MGSFATILGGTLTLIGTSTNLVVSGLMLEAGMRPLGFFELGRIGLPVLTVGLVLLVLFSRMLLKDRAAPREQLTREVREYVMYQRVDEGGPLDGLTVNQLPDWLTSQLNTSPEPTFSSVIA